jgi:hypothetical protein
MGPSTRGQESGSEAALTYRRPQCHKQPYRNYAVVWGTRARSDHLWAPCSSRIKKSLSLRGISSRSICSSPGNSPGSSGWPRRGAIQQKPRPCFGAGAGPRLLLRSAGAHPRHPHTTVRTFHKASSRKFASLNWPFGWRKPPAVLQSRHGPGLDQSAPCPLRPDLGGLFR